MMMQFKFLLFVTIAIVSCTTNEPVSTDLVQPEAAIDTITVSWEDFTTCQIKEGQMIKIDLCIAGLPDEIDMDDYTQSVMLVERRNQTTRFWASMFVTIGADKSTIQENNNEVFILSEKGDTIRRGDYITVIGEYSMPDNIEDHCQQAFIQSPIIHKRNCDFEEELLPQAVQLTKELMLDSSTQMLYSYVDTKIEIPHSIFYESESIWLHLSPVFDVEHFKLNANFLQGQQPSSIDDNLPLTFEKRDVYLFDISENKYRLLDNQFRLYGVYFWINDDNGQFYVEEILWR